MRRTPLEKDNEAAARALRDTSGMLDKLGDAREAYDAAKEDYWDSYELAKSKALRDMENEDGYRTKT